MISLLEKLQQVHSAQARGWCSAWLRLVHCQVKLTPRRGFVLFLSFLYISVLRFLSTSDRKLSEMKPACISVPVQRCLPCCLPSLAVRPQDEDTASKEAPALGCSPSITRGRGPRVGVPRPPCCMGWVTRLRCPRAATRLLPVGRRQSALSVLVSPVTKAIVVALLCSVTSLGVSLEEETVLSGIDF